MNLNRQSTEVTSKNTNLALSQLQPIREGTYVAKLHQAPWGYANAQTSRMTHLPFFIMQTMSVPRAHYVKGTGKLPCCVPVNASFFGRRWPNAFLMTSTLTAVMANLIKFF